MSFKFLSIYFIFYIVSSIFAFFLREAHIYTTIVVQLYTLPVFSRMQYEAARKIVIYNLEWEFLHTAANVSL